MNKYNSLKSSRKKKISSQILRKDVTIASQIHQKSPINPKESFKKKKKKKKK